MRLSATFAMCLLMLSATAWANITTTGEINPVDPATWTDTTDVYVGQYSDATISVDGGSTVTSGNCYVGEESDSTVTISGNGSTWTNSDYFGVGGYGDCNLSITNGGSLINHGFGVLGDMETSQSTAIVSGANSTWHSSETIFLGYYGTGELNITDGGKVESSGYGVLGSQADSMGILNVSGLNSTWTNAEQLHVGYEGYGEINITDGGKVNTPESFLGAEPGSVGIINVSGTGSMLDSYISNNSNRYALVVASEGYGELNITDGGKVKANWCIAGDDFNSTGKITASGSGSALNCQRGICIGGYGNGELNITNGSSVSNTNGTIGSRANVTGTVNVSGPGSIWTNTESSTIGGLGTGILNITGGGTVINNEICEVGDDAEGKGAITVSGIGSTWTNEDVLCLGVSGTGELNITNGGLTSVAERLWLDVSSKGSYINMATGGMLALKGEADDSLLEFLNLTWGTKAIRWWDDSINDWNHIILATPNVDYTLEYLTEGDLAGYTVLTVGTVPEPGSITVILSALLTLWLASRRRKH